MFRWRSKIEMLQQLSIDKTQKHGSKIQNDNSFVLFWHHFEWQRPVDITSIHMTYRGDPYDASAPPMGLYARVEVVR